MIRTPLKTQRAERKHEIDIFIKKNVTNALLASTTNIASGLDMERIPIRSQSNDRAINILKNINQRKPEHGRNFMLSS